jgi:hypothetical protein
MDLNGTLIYRPKASDPSSYRSRPYVSCLLQYLRQSEAWEVGVWSSATGENVARMVTFLGFTVEGGEDGGERKDLGSRGKQGIEVEGLKICWARDTLGLTAAQYSE